VELYEVMRTTSAVRHFTNDPLPTRSFTPSRQRAVRSERRQPAGHTDRDHSDPDTRQALVELTIPATKKYVAQRQAGENPGTPSIQAGVRR
jgi:hypothetical protein